MGMEISALTLKLIILLTPGALAAVIIKRLTIRHKKSTDFMFVIDAILLGMFSYLLLQLIYLLCIWICNFTPPKTSYETLNVFKRISDSGDIPYIEVILASVVSIFLGFIISNSIEKRFINRFARWLNVSQKYGELNLFSYFLSKKDVNWVYVRDIKNNLTYLGYVSSINETDEYKELVLKKVTVLNYINSTEYYDVESVYLCFPKDAVIIEKAIIQKPNTDDGKERQTANVQEGQQ